VREADGGYELIDGERRYRACAEAGVTEVPVVVRDTAPRPTASASRSSRI